MSYRITADELAELQRESLLADRVRAACLEKIATFCGADAMRKDLPIPPTLSEPVLQNLPPPPTDPGVWKVGAEFVRAGGTESGAAVAGGTSSWRSERPLCGTAGRSRRESRLAKREERQRSTRRNLDGPPFAWRVDSPR